MLKGGLSQKKRPDKADISVCALSGLSFLVNDSPPSKQYLNLSELHVKKKTSDFG